MSKEMICLGCKLFTCDEKDPGCLITNPLMQIGARMRAKKLTAKQRYQKKYAKQNDRRPNWKIYYEAHKDKRRADARARYHAKKAATATIKLRIGAMKLVNFFGID